MMVYSSQAHGIEMHDVNVKDTVGATRAIIQVSTRFDQKSS